MCRFFLPLISLHLLVMVSSCRLLAELVSFCRYIVLVSPLCRTVSCLYSFSFLSCTRAVLVSSSCRPRTVVVLASLLTLRKPRRCPPERWRGKIVRLLIVVQIFTSFPPSSTSFYPPSLPRFLYHFLHFAVFPVLFSFSFSLFPFFHNFLFLLIDCFFFSRLSFLSWFSSLFVIIFLHFVVFLSCFFFPFSLFHFFQLFLYLLIPYLIHIFLSSFPPSFSSCFVDFLCRLFFELFFHLFLSLLLEHLFLFIQYSLTFSLSSYPVLCSPAHIFIHFTFLCLTMNLFSFYISSPFPSRFASVPSIFMHLSAACMLFFILGVPNLHPGIPLFSV